RAAAGARRPARPRDRDRRERVVAGSAGAPRVAGGHRQRVDEVGDARSHRAGPALRRLGHPLAGGPCARRPPAVLPRADPLAAPPPPADLAMVADMAVTDMAVGVTCVKSHPLVLLGEMFCDLSPSNVCFTDHPPNGY